MLETIRKTFRISFYTLLIVLGVTFAVSNRGPIELTFYPLPYIFTTRIFFFTLVVFALGIALGWLVARFAALRHRRNLKALNTKLVALENELVALRSERLIKPTSLTRA